MKKISKMSEAAWLFYTVVCALGVVLCTKADFGLSMIAAPPYILHVAISPYLPIFTQGFSQTVWQIFLLAVLCVAVKRVKWKYLWCLAASFLSGPQNSLAEALNLSSVLHWEASMICGSVS